MYTYMGACIEIILPQNSPSRIHPPPGYQVIKALLSQLVPTWRETHPQGEGMASGRVNVGTNLLEYHWVRG